MDMAIPDHVKQNLASIQADLMRGWQTTMSAQPTRERGFDQFLHNAVGRAQSMLAPATSEQAPAFIPLASPGGEGPSAGFQAFMSGLSPSSQSLYATAQQPGAAGQLAAVTAPQVLPGFRSYGENGAQAAAGAIDDRSFFDGGAMTPAQIDKFLRERNSPFANRVYEGGKSAGQLIWETCQQTGDAKYGGPRSINPAMMLAIMGAETSYGRDGTWSKTNPFSIRLNGSFDNVKDFPSSLRIAANTMYNWAQSRPADSKVSLFDFAGSHYCEDYAVEWKPNVEKFYRQAVGFGAERMA